ncbi:MAG: hypothetical protein M0030_18740 [Actinomycetota bacterium]|nr:hypothetical protein [Actinomycetota bacterium]
MNAQPSPHGTSPWLLPEDGITDEIAIELTVTGARRVALTPGERRAAAALILASGGTINRVARRLHIGHRTAWRLADTLTTSTATSDYGAAA